MKGFPDNTRVKILNPKLKENGRCGVTGFYDHEMDLQWVELELGPPWRGFYHPTELVADNATAHLESGAADGSRFRVEERSGIIAVYDTAHPEYDEDSPGCHGDYPWTVCFWKGWYDEKAGHWSLEKRWIEKAHEACRLLNKEITE